MVKTQLDLKDVVLLVLYYSPGRKILGRNILHKIMYLVDKLIGLKEITGCDLRFQPHYYGPFSYPLARAIAKLWGMGFIDIAGVRGKSFTYGNTCESIASELTIPDGVEEVAEKFIIDFPEEAKKIASAVARLRELDPTYRIVSLAAKVLCEAERKRKTYEKAAKKLSWGLSNEDVRAVVEFLNKLGGE